MAGDCGADGATHECLPLDPIDLRQTLRLKSGMGERRDVTVAHGAKSRADWYSRNLADNALNSP